MSVLHMQMEATENRACVYFKRGKIQGDKKKIKMVFDEQLQVCNQADDQITYDYQLLSNNNRRYRWVGAVINPTVPLEQLIFLTQIYVDGKKIGQQSLNVKKIEELVTKGEKSQVAKDVIQGKLLPHVAKKVKPVRLQS